MFVYCSNLTIVKLPQSLTSIGYNVFSGCETLESIVIPEGVTSIDDNAFYNCSITIYCELNTQPSGWYSSWNSSNRLVYWSGQWEYDQNDNSFPLN